jgi:hypothetical protein
MLAFERSGIGGHGGIDHPKEAEKAGRRIERIAVAL